MTIGRFRSIECRSLIINTGENVYQPRQCKSIREKTGSVSDTEHLVKMHTTMQQPHGRITVTQAQFLLNQLSLMDPGCRRVKSNNGRLLQKSQSTDDKNPRRSVTGPHPLETPNDSHGKMLYLVCQLSDVNSHLFYSSKLIIPLVLSGPVFPQQINLPLI